jgi:hypothetical protein
MRLVDWIVCAAGILTTVLLMGCGDHTPTPYQEYHVNGCWGADYREKANGCHAKADVNVGREKAEIPATNVSKDASMLKTVRGEYNKCYTINKQTGYFIEVSCPSDLP